MTKVGRGCEGEVLEDHPVPQVLIDDRGQQIANRPERLVFRTVGRVPMTEGQIDFVRDDVVRHAPVHTNRLQGLPVLTAANDRPALDKAVDAILVGARAGG